jgi:hypothetical protein
MANSLEDIEDRHAAFMNLINWRRMNMRRDEYIRDAAKYGVPKTEIATITGLSRGTIHAIIAKGE